MSDKHERSTKAAALAAIAEKNNAVDPKLLQRYNVKRGLRNDDGSGVLVGLTKVSTVIGYEKIDEDVVPLHGRLIYRGYDITDLIEGHGDGEANCFEETAYLLLFGELPDEKSLDSFKKLLAESRRLPRNFYRDVILTYKTDDIMNSLARSVLTLYSADRKPDSLDPAHLVEQAIQLIARMPVIVAYSYQAIQHANREKSLVIHPPKANLSLAENFLHMLRDDSKYSPLEAKLLDVSLMLHADHGGGNNSTFSTRCVTSSGTDTYAAISTGLCSLKGPLHGGANNSVALMLNDIRAHCPKWDKPENLKKYLTQMINKEVFDKSGKIYGFGHAVYTLSDPRAVILKDYAKKLAAEKGLEKDLELLLMMEEIVPALFCEVKGSTKVISPNVDFFSGFVYTMLGIPPEVFTPLFAMARISGWMSHRIEELLTSKRIIRPAYKNIQPLREYIETKKR